MIPGFGIIRRLIMSFVVMIALFAAGNVIVERMAEDKLAGVVRSTFGLDEDPLVEISGFPIILKVLNGSLPEISLRASGATVEDLTLRRVAASLEDVRIDGGLLTGGKLGARVGTGSVSAEATDEAVNRYLRAHDEKASIAFREDGATVRATRRIAGRNRRVTATGTIRLVKNTLRFVPKRVRVDGEKPPAVFEEEARRRAAIRVPLPELPGGFGPTEVTAHDGYVRIEAVLENERITLRG